MELAFSVNMHDSDGDIWDNCILLHINESTIIRFENLDEWKCFAKSMLGMVNEIKENLESY